MVYLEFLFGVVFTVQQIPTLQQIASYDTTQKFCKFIWHNMNIIVTIKSKVISKSIEIHAYRSPLIHKKEETSRRRRRERIKRIVER